MLFDDLGLSADLLRAIANKGYAQPTPIQQQAIPAVLQGQDLLGAAKTGTGKTAGFTLPMLQRLAQAQPGSGKPVVRALVLTPTRELAAQVSESIQTYSKYMSLKSTVIFGGVNINPQIRQLRKGVDILVATPGRLLDHVNQRTVDLSQVEILVLDEADRMLDMGFVRDIRKILALLPQQRQTLLFSATFSEEIKQLAKQFLHQPTVIEVAQHNTTAERVEQLVHPVDRARKRELLSWMIGANNWQQVLVFTRTKRGADKLAQQLERDGLRAAAIHGDKSQGARTRALADFKSGIVRVLVATDIAARGLDINQLPHVINFELPMVAADYVHRIGRTGRAGKEGTAISLVCVDEHKLLGDIEKTIKFKIPREVIAGYEPDQTIKPEPVQKGRNRKPQSAEQTAATGKRRRRKRRNQSAGQHSPRQQSNGRQRQAAR